MACSAAECVCAKNSMCSCGKQAALNCNCERAAIENAQPPKDGACACGKRMKGQCTCGVAEDSCAREGEIDFTNA